MPKKECLLCEVSKETLEQLTKKAIKQGKAKKRLAQPMTQKGKKPK